MPGRRAAPVDPGPASRPRPALTLGIDPGLAVTGWAVVERSGSRLRAVALGTLRTTPRAAHAARLAALHDGIAERLEQHSVAEAAIEAWFVHPVSRTAMGMAEARGAILVALARGGVEVREYAPNEVKQAVTGHGGADKGQVRAMVGRLASCSPGSDHEADALAAAICHLHSAPLLGALRRTR
jgi:crossover junction endodeoxyribonuclease RuvC